MGEILNLLAQELPWRSFCHLGVGNSCCAGWRFWMFTEGCRPSRQWQKHVALSNVTLNATDAGTADILSSQVFGRSSRCVQLHSNISHRSTDTCYKYLFNVIMAHCVGYENVRGYIEFKWVENVWSHRKNKEFNCVWERLQVRTVCVPVCDRLRMCECVCACAHVCLQWSVCTHLCTCFSLYMPVCMSRRRGREAKWVSLWNSGVMRCLCTTCLPCYLCW